MYVVDAHFIDKIKKNKKKKSWTQVPVVKDHKMNLEKKEMAAFFLINIAMTVVLSSHK
jgi:hypothetical protein